MVSAKPDGFGQILLTSATLRELGVGIEFAEEAGIAERGSVSSDGVEPVSLFAVEDLTLLDTRLTATIAS